MVNEFPNSFGPSVHNEEMTLWPTIPRDQPRNKKPTNLDECISRYAHSQHFRHCNNIFISHTYNFFMTQLIFSSDHVRFWCMENLLTTPDMSNIQPKVEHRRYIISFLRNFFLTIDVFTVVLR